MIKIRNFVVIGLAATALSGCSAADNSAEETTDSEVLQATLTAQEEIIAAQASKIEALESELYEKEVKIDKLSRDFTYLSAFSALEEEAYQRFLETDETRHLTDLSPEKITLLYYHAITENDLETLYTLTYDNGSLPSFDGFKQLYLDSDYMMSAKDSTVRYRNYDSVRSRDDDRTEEYVTVEIKGHFRTYGFSTLYGLKKEDGIWKMDTLELM
ncbi:hypothetical protein SAMN04488102_10737 [Alkalibacterium subtropicum]|uniref:Uncharacterized protein n=1 Tax=Alkalibacterium subtropicum TaxID=753702 RepID=A0A1I1JEY7_9LACT|nr:hypothetical protein [Alkalibacterium subtropicum]SFC45178.1 hypothetical protein SAMN04488102_10737 [Alkalibacterium subtropicum]